MRTMFLALVAIAASLAGLVPAPARAAGELPAGPHRDIAYGKCRTCHSLQYLTDSSGLSRSQWDSVLTTMRKLGMPKIGDPDRGQLLDYLAAYLGPNPPKEGQAPAAAEAEGAGQIDAASLFRQQCASCHQPDGKGAAGKYPPLDGNADLFAARDFPVLVVLNGLQGKMDVAGKSYDGAMPAFDFLADNQIAALVNYLRSAWENAAIKPPGLADVTAADVKAARGKDMDAAAVQTYRQSLE